MDGSRIMEFSSYCPQAGCPRAKLQKAVFREVLNRKIWKKFPNINYID